MGDFISEEAKKEASQAEEPEAAVEQVAAAAQGDQEADRAAYADTAADSKADARGSMCADERTV